MILITKTSDQTRVCMYICRNHHPNFEAPVGDLPIIFFKKKFHPGFEDHTGLLIPAFFVCLFSFKWFSHATTMPRDR